MENKNHSRISSVSQENQKSDFKEMGVNHPSYSIIYFIDKKVNFIYMKQFNKKEYDLQYDKTHYKQFKAKIKNEEMDKINNLLAKNEMNKTEFVQFGKKILEGEYEMKKTMYYIESQNLNSDFIDSEKFETKEKAEEHWNWLKDCNINSQNGNNQTEYRFMKWTVECDEFGDPVENADGFWDEIDSFTTNKLL